MDRKEEEESVPEVDIHISNVVCNFSTRCHLNLRTLATNGANVVYKREQGMVSMKIRRPKVTASIWSSGKITCTGATSNEDAKKGGRRIARVLQKLGFRVRFSAYRVVNVLGTVILPFGIRIDQFTQEHRSVCSYEPELHPGATYRCKEIKAVLKIFQTGAITVTAPSITNVQLSVEHIYPLVYEFRKEKPRNVQEHHEQLMMKKRKLSGSAEGFGREDKRVRSRKSYHLDDTDEEDENQSESDEGEGEFTSGDDSDNELDTNYYSDKSDA